MTFLRKVAITFLGKVAVAIAITKKKCSEQNSDPTTIKMKKLAEITRNILKSCDFDSSILFLILSPAEVSRNWSIVSRDARSNFWLLLTFKKIAV